MSFIHFPGLARRVVACAHDMAALVLCWFVAYWLRFNLDVPADFLHGAMLSVPLLIALHTPIYWLMGLYRGIWRYASVMDLRRIILAVGLAAVGLAAAILMLGVPFIPRSVLLLHPILLVVVMGGSRFVYRAWKDRALYGHLALGGEPVLILGAGDAAERLLRELAHSHDWRVVGLLDDKPRRAGTELRGVRIFGPIADIAAWPWVKNYDWSGVSIEGLNHLQAWITRLGQRPAFQKGIQIPVRPAETERIKTVSTLLTR